jgi:E-phenylitaconyl-CoA hydratase
MPTTGHEARGDGTPAGAGDDAAAILVRRDGGVGWVTINRPERRNAIDAAARQLLAGAFADLDADPEIRVIVLTGAGDAFCAGVDLADAGAPTDHPLVARAAPLSTPLDVAGKPVIAAVNGPAMGGGFELALAADLRMASTNARFALPEVRIGSLPGSGGTQRIFRALPSAIAARLLFTGEAMDAAEAYRVGLVSDLLEPADLPAAVEARARRVAEGAPLSLIAAKRAARAALADEAGRALERTLWGFLATSEDRAEGRAAFRERRAPRFRGR